MRNIKNVSCKATQLCHHFFIYLKPENSLYCIPTRNERSLVHLCLGKMKTVTETYIETLSAWSLETLM